MSEKPNIPSDVDLKRGTRVRVTLTGALVAKPTKDGTVRIRVDNLPSWYAVVPVSRITAEDQRCYWIKDGDRCVFRVGHEGSHHV